MMVGGLSEEQPATPEIQEMVNQVKAELEQKENKKFSTFKAVCYRSQVVQGINYFVKVDVGNNEFVHLKLFEPLRHEGKPLSLDAYQTKKTKEDELEYF